MLGNEKEAIALLEDGIDYLEAQAKDFNKKLQLDVPLLRDCFFSYGYE